MLQSFFNGLSGLFSFSKSLQTVSNNISNMNTPGYRANDSFFRSLSGETGTSLAGTGVRLAGGEVRQTGNPSDLALNGAGFYVLRNEQGELFYSRAGQFQFNDDGILVDSVSKAEVMSMDAQGVLKNINISERRRLAAQATSSISFSGNLPASGGAHNVAAIQVFDAQGGTQNISATFTQTAANIWKVEVKNAGGTVISTQEIRFGADGTPLAGFNELTVTLTANGQNQSVKLKFGDPGSFSKTTQLSGSQSTLSARAEDGHGVLGMTSYAFDEKGVLTFTYSNGEKVAGPRLALAAFADETQLQQASGSLYRAPNSAKVEYGLASEGRFGTVKGGSLELSNVDLTQEFADMMIIQRGYQASSRVMSVANEMVEQLYNNSRGG